MSDHILDSCLFSFHYDILGFAHDVFTRLDSGVTSSNSCPPASFPDVKLQHS